MSETKNKVINYKKATELELKIEAALREQTLNKYISHLLDLHAETLRKKRNLTI